ncbi:MAG: C1 family peptidase [Methanothrix sp.]|nr:C1 family peptidase [Methanothrix sp.]
MYLSINGTNFYDENGSGFLGADGNDIPDVDNVSEPFIEPLSEPSSAPSDSEMHLSINGTNFYDENGNGFLDPGETGLPGWTIRLIQDGDEIANAVTDDVGDYRFSDLAPGSYVVLEDLQPEWNQTAPGGGWYEITLTDKNAQRYDFGNYNGSVDRLLAEFEHPLMRPSPEQMKRWVEEYEAAPLAPLDPNVTARLDAEPLGYFSLLGRLKYTPSERDQGYCGDCWAWAGTGVMEIALDVQRGVKDRLSVQYLNSNFDGGSGSDWACCGGWISDVAYFYSAADKAIPWSNANAHWQDRGRWCWDQLTSVPGSDISTNPGYPITSIEDQSITTFGDGATQVTKEDAISNIKNVLNQNKAVWFAFFLPTDNEWDAFGYFWNHQPETAVWDPSFPSGKQLIDGEFAGHAVLCVGYDDTDPNNRYWIMLNSWGAPSNRPNGLFRVSMDMDYDNLYHDPYDDLDYYAFYWETLELDYSEDVGTDPGMTKTLMAAGSTTPGATDWVQYGSNGLYLDVDTSSAGFTETPIYITSLGGTNIWATTGATSIYVPTPTGFRIFVKFSNGAQITPDQANLWNWHIQWVGIIPRSLTNVGSTPPGDTDWKQYSYNTVYLDVDTSSAGFTETPIYLTSLGGTNIWATTGATSIYVPTPTGFRIFVQFSNGAQITPEQANLLNWHIRWVGIN